MEEMDIIVNYIQQATNPDVDYIWGTGVDNSLGDKLSITLVATGFEAKPPQQPVERGHDKIPLPTPTHPQNTTISQPSKTFSKDATFVASIALKLYFPFNSVSLSFKSRATISLSVKTNFFKISNPKLPNAPANAIFIIYFSFNFLCLFKLIFIH
jgi:hypothetical protein